MGTFNDKWNHFKSVAQTSYNRAKAWTVENSDFLMIAVPTVLGVGTAIGKSAVRHHRIAEEQHLKDCYWYDRSSGHYWETRRPLRTSEKLEIERRRDNGESLGYILSSMRLLKR